MLGVPDKEEYLGGNGGVLSDVSQADFEAKMVKIFGKDWKGKTQSSNPPIPEPPTENPRTNSSSELTEQEKSYLGRQGISRTEIERD